MLVLGDAHASDPDRCEILLELYRTLEPDRVLQLGDLERYDLPAPTWFIAGNNEDFDVIDALRAGEHPAETNDNVHLLASTAAAVDGLRVAGLGQLRPHEVRPAARRTRRRAPAALHPRGHRPSRRPRGYRCLPHPRGPERSVVLRLRSRLYVRRRRFSRRSRQNSVWSATTTAIAKPRSREPGS